MANIDCESVRMCGLFPLEFLNNHIKRYLFHNFHLRDMTLFMKKHFKDYKGLIGVEIGVLCGLNTRVMFQHLPIEKLYCVDPYTCYNNYNIYEDGDKNFILAKKNLRKYLDRIEFLKTFSFDAVKNIPDGLNFVYIDGNHSYNSVKQDINLYYPKVRKGGVLGGHDFYAQCDKDNGVARAVLEFVEEYDLELMGKEGYDWFVVKNGEK